MWNRDMAAAPRDGSPIFAWCEHAADERLNGSTCPDGSMSVYAAHVEGLSHVEDGPQVVVWGGGWSDHYEDGGGYLPDWWFQKGSEFEVAAFPVAWISVPAVTW